MFCYVDFSPFHPLCVERGPVADGEHARVLVLRPGAHMELCGAQPERTGISVQHDEFLALFT